MASLMDPNAFNTIDVNQFNNKFLSLKYANQSSNQILDVFLPEEGEGPFPLVVLIHGGGFLGGHKLASSLRSQFKIISQGYAIATIEYRLGLEANWPAAVYDTKAAIRYLRANHQRLNINTEKILVWGNSAGATVAEMVAATSGTGLFEDLSMGNSEYSSSVQSLLAWFGLSDMFKNEVHSEKMSREVLSQVTGVDQSLLDDKSDEMINAVSLALGCNVLTNKDLADSVSPINYITENFPPSLFQHGTKDMVVMPEQSVMMVEKITGKCGVGRATIEMLQGAIHGDPMFKSDENILRCLEFIDLQLKGSVQPRTELPEIKLV